MSNEQCYFFYLSVVIDYHNDQNALTGDFELIYECSIARYYHPKKIQLNIDGKKILPSAPRSIFQLKKSPDLSIQGKKLSKPIKSRYRIQREPMEIKIVKPEGLNLKLDTAENPSKSSKMSFNKFKARKLYKSPQKQRRLLQTIIVKPSYSNGFSYVDKLPSRLQSPNPNLVNLNDLIRYLNIEENVL